ncbi:MAG: YfcE family phosphodiesterase [Mycoplasmataceae bacterium]|nr:YfcE family phosphodiesterase [Mycoplasmataceae bacterium]
MTTVIILSDTHTRNDITTKILKSNSYDIAIHAGDYECDLNYMMKNFDYFVKGNNDFDSQVSEQYFEIEGLKFYLQHGHLLGTYSDLDNDEYMEKIADNLNVDVIIHGHTHVTKITHLENNKYIINPGSTWLPRGSSKPSYLILSINNGKIVFETKLVMDL